jgi:hypothetical protein
MMVAGCAARAEINFSIFIFILGSKSRFGAKPRG